MVFVERGPLGKFSSCFPEGCELLQGLSVRYLWIDSLCIIQSGEGSIQDWEFELTRMHEVYSKGILTVVLARPRSPNESCLTGGNILDVIPPFDIETSRMGTL